MEKHSPKFQTAVIAGAALLAVLLAFAAAMPVILLIQTENNTKKKIYDPETEGEVLRLHIIANSDGAEDQRVKLAVRDAVLGYEREKEALLGTDDARRAESELLSDGAGLLDTVRSVLRAEGCDYDAQLVLGDFDFPDREYDGELYPAGNYRALRIILGKGEGRNWWCILFPPLCIIRTETPAKTAEPEPAYPIRFESLFVRLFGSVFGGK